MADVIDYRIVGDDMQIVEVELDPGEGVRAEAGAMLFMSDGIQMQTGTDGDVVTGVLKAVALGVSAEEAEQAPAAFRALVPTPSLSVTR